MRLAVLIPQKDFRDESLSIMRLIASKWGIQVSIAAYGKNCIGMRGASLHADINPSDITTDKFDGIVLIDGKGIDDQRLYDYRPLLDILNHFNDNRKKIISIGNAVKIPARANIIKGKKIAVADVDSAQMVKLFYGIPTNSDIELMDNIVTIRNSSAVEDKMEELLMHIGVM